VDKTPFDLSVGRNEWLGLLRLPTSRNPPTGVYNPLPTLRTSSSYSIDLATILNCPGLRHHQSPRWGAHNCTNNFLHLGPPIPFFVSLEASWNNLLTAQIHSGNFHNFCKDSTLPVCNLFPGYSYADSSGFAGGCELVGIPLKNGRHLGNLGSSHGAIREQECTDRNRLDTSMRHCDRCLLRTAMAIGTKTSSGGKKVVLKSCSF
jgi:hypothetical protein